jgi:glutathione S-transferase
MTYSLYYSPGAASMAVHWMLIEMVIPFDARLIDIDVGAQRTDEYRRLNPSGRVPTLVVDSVARGESGSLLMLLAEHHPVAVLAPAPGSSDRAEWLVNAREGLTDWSNSAHSANDNV